MKKIISGLILGIFMLPAYSAWNADLIKKAEVAATEFRNKDKTMEKFFTKSKAYAVFPNVGKGAFFIGGMNGEGVVFENGVATGYTELTAITIGFQAGGQAFMEIIFFENAETLENFKHGDLKFSAQVSAVAVTAGASADANYKSGVAIFTMAVGGLMLEASVGGQGFKYEPISGTK